MIFYLSGTGNSYCVAKEVSEITNEKLINIAEAWRKHEFSYDVKDGERIGFVYPIHAWAPPTLVKRFIKKLQLNNSKGAYVYSLLTCGEDWEGAVEHLNRALAHIGLSVQGDFKIVMPDNYIIGGGIDSPEFAKKKLEEAPETIKAISKEIINKTFNYKRVKYSFLKSNVVYGFFQLSKIIPLFRTSDECVGCGMCEKVCPMNVITMKEKNNHKVPSWGRGCIQCLACINVCPKKAIDSLGAKEKERRYFNPDYKKELFNEKVRD